MITARPVRRCTLAFLAVAFTLAAPVHAGPGAERAYAPADCDQFVPAGSAAAALVPTYRAQPRLLRVLVLAAPADLPLAREAARDAARAYDSVGIRLQTTVRAIAVPKLSEASDDWLAFLKKKMGGKRPVGTDAVYLATTRTLDSGGRADCIGGIADADSAFAVGMLELAGIVGVSITGLDLPIDPSKDGPPIPNMGGLVLAHELGHLLGAHHHYGEGCKPGTADPQHACDLMQTISPQTLGLYFAPITTAVIRDHADRYLRPASPASPTRG